MATCRVSGIVYNGEGVAAANIALRFTPLSITGVAMSVATVHATTSAAGELQDERGTNQYIDLIQGGTYKLKGAILGGYNVGTGENIQIPTEATADFSDLISVEAIPSEGLTVQSNGTPLPTLIGTFNIVGATVEQTSAGVARLTFVGSGLADGDKGDVTVSGGVWTIDAGAINNAKVAAGAAIAYSKLNLTGAILNADLAGGIAQSKITDLVTDLAAKATTGYVDAAIANLVDSSPGTLDTLNELAAALGDDPNFATTITTLIGTKLAKASNLSDLTDASAARTNLGLVIGTNVQAHSGDLAAIAALTPSNDDLLQRKAGAWTNRTLAQYKTDLALVKADVGLGNVENTALSTWAGSTNLTTLGTIATGTWNATAIAYNKLTLTGSIVNADISNSAAIAYSKLNLTGAILNADLAGSIAISKLSISGTPDGTKFLRDDGSWAAAGGGSQTPWTANVDADGFSLLVDDGTGIFSSETGNPELLKFTSVASAVNELTVTNAATGNSPILSATGGDTNVGMTFTVKAAGNYLFNMTQTTGLVRFGGTSNAFPAFAHLPVTNTKATLGLYNADQSDWALIKANSFYSGPDNIILMGSNGGWGALNSTVTGFVPFAASQYSLTGAGTSHDVVLKRVGAAIFGIEGAAGAGASMDFLEMTAPGTPGANHTRLYAEDNGSGKTRIVAKWDDGSTTVIATQP